MKEQAVYSSTNAVKRFPQKGGWVYVSIDQTYADLGMKKPKWGLVPATITVGKTTWKKSLLPFGGGSLFVSFSEKIRNAEKIEVGDTVTVIVKV
jgi:hypothetical protein